MKNKIVKIVAIKLLFILLSITFFITIFCLINLFTLKKKEGFDAFTSFFTETLPGVVDDVGDAALKPVLDLLRSIKSDFESINTGVNNLENEVLSVGERIDLIIRKKTSEITGEEITKGESLQRNQGIKKIFNKIGNVIKKAAEEARQESEGNTKESPQIIGAAAKKALERVREAAQRAVVAAQPAAEVAQPAAVAAQPAAEVVEGAKAIFRKMKKKF